MDDKIASDRYANGLSTRREVLGEQWVENAMAGATEFNQPIQDLLNEYCWGYVWTRNGLSRKVRSLLNIAMLAGSGAANELKGHVRGALRNGASPDEIAETLLQVAVYRGVPSAVDGFRLAAEAIAQHQASDD